jgi:diaminopimelate epimerase
VSDHLEISKYHGTGNDFVFLEDLDDRSPLDPALVAALCNRHTGVGADGVIRVVAGSGGSDFFMDYRNADGSLAEMCGNGVRCLGKLVFDRGLTSRTELEVDTRNGVRHLSLDVRDGVVAEVTVGMGPPSFRRSEIPMSGPGDGSFLSEPFELGDGRTVKASALSMGNPHLVLFIEGDPADEPVRELGPRLERHEWFPQKANVEFAQLRGEGLKARVWERGSEETMACGTGACAVAVAAHEAGLVPATTFVEFPGGRLRVDRRDDDVLLTGPAEKVFDATIDGGWLASRGEGRP